MPARVLVVSNNHNHITQVICFGTVLVPACHSAGTGCGWVFPKHPRVVLGLKLAASAISRLLPTTVCGRLKRPGQGPAASTPELCYEFPLVMVVKVSFATESTYSSCVTGLFLPEALTNAFHLSHGIQGYH